jgi:hypothetical protein
MTVVRGGKITPYNWTDAAGKRRKSWRWSVNVDGRQRRRQGYATKAEAETGLDQLKAELAAPKAKPEVTLSHAAERYLATTTNRGNPRSRDERRIVAHLVNEFSADTPLREITAARVSAYKDQRRGVAERTGRERGAAAINRPLATLRHMLQLAHTEWELISEVPRIRLEREPQHRIVWLEPEEEHRLLDAACASRRSTCTT